MTTHIKFCDAVDVGGSSIEAKARVAETITESGTSQATTITALQNEVAVITATADILVGYGSSPTAVADSGDLCTAGGRIFIRMNAGDKIAVKTP